MSASSQRGFTVRRPECRAVLVAGGVLVATLCGCGKKPASGAGSTDGGPRSAAAAIGVADWVQTCLELARERAVQAPDEALAIAVDAWQADPTSLAAREWLSARLAATTWHLPEVALPHPGPIDQLQLRDPAALWVAVGGETPTVVRWDLEKLRVAAVLFPRRGAAHHTLQIDPQGKRVLVERAGTPLWCDAGTLKPIAVLDPLPPALTPSAVVAFSPDGLLFAHPVMVDGDPRRIAWHLRDAERGELLRASEPGMPDDPAPVAAHLDRVALRVMRGDGSVWSMPVSPAEPGGMVREADGKSWRRARFAQAGDAVLGLRDLGPHRVPECERIAWGTGDDGSLAPAALLAAESWTRLPSGWNDGLLPAAIAAPEVDAEGMRLPATNRYRTGSPVTAALFRDDRHWIGCRDGRLTMHRVIPAALVRAGRGAAPGAAADRAAIDAMRHFARGFGGVERVAGKPVVVAIDERRAAVAACDLEALGRAFPELDFTPLAQAVADWKPCVLPDDATAALEQRLVRFRERPALPELAALHREVSDEAVVEAIRHAGGKGAAAARHLEWALASDRPARIATCLEVAVDLPPLLRRLALSRIAWIEGRRADAIAAWPDGFPDLARVAATQDWDGWEQADFTAAWAGLRDGIDAQLARLTLPPDSTPEQRRALIAHLDDPGTAKAVGRARFAKACREAALALAGFQEESAATFRLATLARTLGDEPVPCLRAEALALTALGDYRKAHDRWLMILGDHPVATHEPGDYAEAAYTAFENADPRHAMAILATGTHRYPDDANFALRAGWVALLTGNPEPAYRFLLTGMRIGYPEDKLENATALLAIAAAKAGAPEDAEAFFRELLRLEPAWREPATIDSLEWPEELKAPLRELGG